MFVNNKSLVIRMLGGLNIINIVNTLLKKNILRKREILSNQSAEIGIHNLINLKNIFYSYYMKNSKRFRNVIRDNSI